ncbi:MAG: zinc-dependent peptidase [Bacteroidetes bacterium]|nr:zinc-dependent peptidase [Bacteroidota bacterium]
MDVAALTLLIIAILALAFLIVLRSSKKEAKIKPLPASYKQILLDNVLFYQRLDDEGKKNFENRVERFLSTIIITGAGTTVEDIDRVLIGASAIIPIYAFPHWEYSNLDEVILYPETFNEQFEIQGNNRSVLGMVGDGPMQRTMILSQAALREGFSNKTDKNNTAIHEFVHLLDKTDGATDGIPEILLQHKYVLPWVEMMHKNIDSILKNKSDINPYGATNQAEFFAVVSEYFFERPHLLESKHPDLYAMLSMMFAKKNI